ncbi:hypothetical protein HYW76_02210 [Candidatus Pacearchaeota archaeon]|nr:hypothetical protein [Candidatus Pacearchaeota archaeon]
MIVKILGILDILSAVIFWVFSIFHILPKSLLMVVAFYLLIKGVVFLISKDIPSALDVASAFIIFLSLDYTLPIIIPLIVSLFLLQKGVFSLLG